MRLSERGDVISQLLTLLREHYVFPEVADVVANVLLAQVANGHYASAETDQEFADAVTSDLQSVNGDKHLRLIHHQEALPDRFGEDDADLEGMRRWAEATCGGVARVERLRGNVGYLVVEPILFPPSIAGDAIAAAMTVVASTEALIIDLRRCLGGEPSMGALLCSYLFDVEPVELSGIYQRNGDRTTQRWTLPYVPGRRFGSAKGAYLLTSATTFSGGENVAYDLQQMHRATVVGERTRGGAHPRRGFRVQSHLEATIPVARSVSPLTGGNWERTGVAPDVEVSAEMALSTAYGLALDRIVADGTAQTDVLEEARQAIAGGADALRAAS